MTTTNNLTVVKTVFDEWIATAAKNPDVIGYNLSFGHNSHISLELLFKQRDDDQLRT